MTKKLAALTLSTALVALASPVLAQNQGDWTVGIGAGYLEPKSDNGTLAGLDAEVDSDVSAIFTVEYFVRDNLGIELLAATPFSHEVTLGGSVDAGSLKHLPPTLSLNYHFDTGTAWKPYVGAGINYTIFFDESSALGDLELDNSVGIALQAGLDYAITEQGAVRLNVRWFDIDSDVTLDGADIGEAEIDPWLIGVSYVHRF
ncbi:MULTISPECIES: OmpW family outer membrane protein [unclassified Ruegeria]|uniref:OmpW/AlkL family protein n=1 Tax=unclassified Ruegeria TaxID=2625375 RepID=UPI001ADB4C49|nr:MULTISPECIES: OmpW family outer membrane protein [unclassified Ruegeria]MBO9413848.1 outer membrane beta-barrel protein [Ruegeria sp. R8_1]MBO9417799.1 outer membrane beta-barrel protein [Ruegeria sp. R8_2]